MTFNKFITKYDGGKWDFDGAYKSQCTDLFRFYVRDVLGISQPKSVVGAKDFWANYETDPILKTNFEKVANTPSAIPQEGDVIIWNGKVGGGFGHVAMAVRGNIETFVSLDQNWRGQLTTDQITHDYKNIYGWLHPLSSPSEPSSDTLSPSVALPTYWYEINEAVDARKRSLIALNDAWDTVLTKYIEHDKELNAQKAFYDEETDALIKKNKTEVEELNKYADSLEEKLNNLNEEEPIMDIEYPDYKKALVEGRRIFILAMLAQLAVTLPNWDVTAGYFASWSHFWQFLVLPLLLAGFKAVLKYAQDKYGQGDYDKLIYKI